MVLQRLRTTARSNSSSMLKVKSSVESSLMRPGRKGLLAWRNLLPLTPRSISIRGSLLSLLSAQIYRDDMFYPITRSRTAEAIHRDGTHQLKDSTMIGALILLEIGSGNTTYAHKFRHLTSLPT